MGSWVQDKAANKIWLVCVKATFDVRADGRVRPAAEQVPRCSRASRSTATSTRASSTSWIFSASSHAPTCSSTAAPGRQTASPRPSSTWASSPVRSASASASSATGGGRSTSPAPTRSPAGVLPPHADPIRTCVRRVGPHQRRPQGSPAGGAQPGRAGLDNQSERPPRPAAAQHRGSRRPHHRMAQPPRPRRLQRHRLPLVAPAGARRHLRRRLAEDPLPALGGGPRSALLLLRAARSAGRGLPEGRRAGADRQHVAERADPLQPAAAGLRLLHPSAARDRPPPRDRSRR